LEEDELPRKRDVAKIMNLSKDESVKLVRAANYVRVNIKNPRYGDFTLGKIVHETPKAILISGTSKSKDSGFRDKYRDHWIPKRAIEVVGKVKVMEVLIGRAHGEYWQVKELNMEARGIAQELGITEADVDPKELEIGTEVEKEHYGNPRLARMIALDHLAEIPDYYTRLEKMEKQAKLEKAYFPYHAESAAAFLEEKGITTRKKLNGMPAIAVIRWAKELGWKKPKGTGGKVYGYN